MTVSEPLVGRFNCQSRKAEQNCSGVDHVKVADCPTVMTLGLTVKDVIPVVAADRRKIPPFAFSHSPLLVVP